MVDAGDLLQRIAHILIHAHILQQTGGADLHAVAQTNGLHTGVALHVAGQHGHGVGVVEQPCVGADLFHILGKIRHDGNSTQSAEDTADAQGVGDGLTQTVFLGDLKVDDGAGLVATHLDGVDHKLGATERLLAVLHTQVSLDGSLAAGNHLALLFNDDARFLQPLGIDVVEGELSVTEAFRHHGVAKHVANKNGTTRTHKGNFHRDPLSCNKVTFSISKFLKISIASCNLYMVKCNYTTRRCRPCTPIYC